MGGDPGGVRANLAGVGVTYGVNYAGEFFDVARGGVTRGTSINGRPTACGRAAKNGWRATIGPRATTLTPLI